MLPNRSYHSYTYLWVHQKRYDMILLKKDNYYKVFEPLKNVTFNKLFARAVIENHVSGSVYVDDVQNPKIFYVVHPYGMSLLFGDSNNEEFNSNFRDHSLNIKHTRDTFEWMQAFPDSWNTTLSDLFKNVIIKSSDNLENIENKIIELNTRVNFKFNLNKYLAFKHNYIKKKMKIVRTDENIFANMKGSVVPSKFWNTPQNFVENGVGFSLFHEDQLATTAFSSCILDNQLELGMETLEEFRGNGFALYACSALIDYCLNNNFEPIWACRLENLGSYNLAMKLGFEPVKKHQYYRLSK